MTTKISLWNMASALATMLFVAVISSSCEGLGDSYEMDHENPKFGYCNTPIFYNNQAGIYKGLILKDEGIKLDTICECRVEFEDNSTRALIVHNFPGKLLAQILKDGDGFAGQRKMLESMTDSITLKYRYRLIGFIIPDVPDFTWNPEFPPYYPGVFDYQIEDSINISTGVVNIPSRLSNSVLDFGISAVTWNYTLDGDKELSDRKKETEGIYDYSFCNGILLSVKWLDINGLEMPLKEYPPKIFIRIYEYGTENLANKKD